MLSVIGIGPGSQAMMTMEAVEALQAAEIIVGYKTYTHLVKAFTGDKQVIKTGMCKEIERCQAAIELAQAGHNVALISSGDAGIYGMAGLVLELVSKQKLDVEVRLIPGMTASIAAASLLGAPLSLVSVYTTRAVGVATVIWRAHLRCFPPANARKRRLVL